MDAIPTLWLPFASLPFFFFFAALPSLADVSGEREEGIMNSRASQDSWRSAIAHDKTESAKHKKKTKPLCVSKIK